MAGRSQKLTVVIAATAQRELIRIWDFNAEARGERAADAWDTFLRKKIEDLAAAHNRGKPVQGFPNLKYVSAKKRPKAHGHIIVFEVDEAAMQVSVLHVFHTRQDIFGCLGRDGS